MDRLLLALEQESRYCEVELPCRYIQSANSNIDVAQDFAMAAYVGELLCPLCSSITYKRDFSTNYPSFRFLARIAQVDAFLKVLTHFATVDDDEDQDRDQRDTFWNNFSDFTDRLWEETVAFPSLADEYLLNLVIGQGYDNIGDEEDVEEWQRFFPLNPEARFQFITSNACHSLPGKIFSSPRVIVASSSVPSHTVISQAWAEAGRCPKTSHEGTLVFSEFGFYVYCDGSEAVQIDFSALNDARKMLRECFAVYDLGEHKCHFSTGGEYCVLAYNDWNIILFPGDVRLLPTTAVEALLAHIEHSTDLLRSSLGRPTCIRCPWEKLDDDGFERLCYDVIACIDRFDASSLKKMGKSRSRDGGRDLEVTSRPALGGAPKKWIVQCKAIGATSSLGGTGVQISDVMDQFGATGFVIMTSGLIDSTLYDKVVAIAGRRGFEFDVWDQLRLERFLAEHREIKERYFGK